MVGGYWADDGDGDKHGSYAQHVRRELDFNGFFGAILPAGAAMPALFRIFQVWDILFLRWFHIYRVGRADRIAQTTARAFFHINNGWHHPPPTKTL